MLEANVKLKEGLIRDNVSPCVFPAILVYKIDESYIMCVDRRDINKITIKY